MTKIILYVKNVAIAVSRVVKAVLGLYKYHPDDSYIKSVLVALDCLGNTLALGDPDETVSSRSAKAQAYEQSKGEYGWGCRVCSFLAVFQENHCGKALERNKGSRAVDSDEGGSGA